MTIQDRYEIIEAYINGQLTGAELSDFEAKLQSDSDLAAQVLLFKDIDAGLSDKSVLDFQALVHSEGEAFLQKNTSTEAAVKKIGWSRSFLGIAATLLVLVVSTFIYWQINSGKTLSGKALYAQHFDTYTLNQSIRSNDTAEDPTFQIAVEQYRSEDFKAATATFQKLATNAEQDMVLSFCLAYAYLNQKTPQFDLAQAQFQKIIDEGQSIYVHRAKWYLALIYLEKEERSKAETLLKDLANSPNKIGQQAAAVLKDL